MAAIAAERVVYIMNIIEMFKKTCELYDTTFNTENKNSDRKLVLFGQQWAYSEILLMMCDIPKLKNTRIAKRVTYNVRHCYPTNHKITLDMEKWDAIQKHKIKSL